MCQRKHRTPGKRVSVHCARPATGVHNGTRTSLPAKPSPNPDDAGPIVRQLVSQLRPAATEPGLEPRISSGTAMQCLRPLHHSGGLRQIYIFFQILYLHYLLPATHL
jgi:hypothetical protein